MNQTIPPAPESFQGFSKLAKQEKINLLASLSHDPQKFNQALASFWHNDPETQKLFEQFSENTLSNYFLPFGVIPGMLINGREYCVPMAIEESSVVAAASKSAKYWSTRGGFQVEVIGTTKIGQVHFKWHGHPEKLERHFQSIKDDLLRELAPLTENMRVRGGGPRDIVLINKTALEPHYYQVLMTFETCDAMGANFINTILEKTASFLRDSVAQSDSMVGDEKNLLIIMAILSNYTPECRVKSFVSCPVDALAEKGLSIPPELFAEKMATAVRISKIDRYRATTHNKGIMNGIDGVVLATGNDFRAVEACAHSYASRDGEYRGLSDCLVENGNFNFWLEMPMALGTVGGLTSLHPLAKISLEMLGNPSAKDLMGIAVSVGLAQNFAALRSLTTVGIQQGHMRMHLINILNQLGASGAERKKAIDYFENNTVSFKAVRDLLERIRQYH